MAPKHTRSNDTDTNAMVPVAKRQRTTAPTIPGEPDEQSESAVPTSHFLRLPREIREVIYSYALRTDAGWVEPINWSRAEGVRNSKQRLEQMLRDHVRLPGAQSSSRLAHCSCGRTHLISMWEDPPKEGLKLLKYGLLFANKQIFGEVLPFMVKANGLKITGHININYPCPEFYRALQIALPHAHHVQIEVPSILDGAWWMKILEAKTNLYSFEIIIPQDAMGDMHYEDEDTIVEKFEGVFKLKPREKGGVYCVEKGKYPVAVAVQYHDLEALTGNMVQGWLDESINDRLLTGR